MAVALSHWNSADADDDYYGAPDTEEYTPRDVTIAPALAPLISLKARYKVGYGGRASTKSWGFARHFLAEGAKRPIRLLCAREIQKSIKESVHQLLQDQIFLMGLGFHYTVYNDRIEGRNGTKITFEGLRHNTTKIKGYEGLDYVWIEEADQVTEESWNILKPTVRKAGSEIWLSYNPYMESDYIHNMFVMNTPPPRSVIVNVNYWDNPYLSEEILEDIEYMKETDYDLYLHIYCGHCFKMTKAQVFNGAYSVKKFKTPSGAVFYSGLDFGFASDPTVFVRMFIQENTLYIDKASYYYHVDIADLPELILEEWPEASEWVIRGDSADTGSIRYLKNRGLKVRPCKKGAGSIKAGIRFLHAFDNIVIHEDLVTLIREFTRYSYKTDPTGEVLPIIIDAFNHGPDAIRYAISNFIKLGKVK